MCSILNRWFVTFVLMVNKFHPDPNIALNLQTFNFFSWFLCCTMGTLGLVLTIRICLSAICKFYSVFWFLICLVLGSAKYCLILFYCGTERSSLLIAIWGFKFRGLNRCFFSFNFLFISKIFRNYWTPPPTPKLRRRRRRQLRKLWARRQQLQC